MNRTALLLAAALAGASSLGCAGDPAIGSSASFATAAFTALPSESGALTIEVRTAPSQPPLRGIDSVEYSITDKDGLPAEGLTLTVLPWMPAMGHGASTTPQVADMGDGRYVISDVELFMGGEWQLRTSIAPDQDSATPTFQIP